MCEWWDMQEEAWAAAVHLWRPARLQQLGTTTACLRGWAAQLRQRPSAELLLAPQATPALAWHAASSRLRRARQGLVPQAVNLVLRALPRGPPQSL